MLIYLVQNLYLWCFMHEFVFCYRSRSPPPGDVTAVKRKEGQTAVAGGEGAQNPWKYLSI